jgi:endonuclease YncB( thermonuclease family)
MDNINDNLLENLRIADENKYEIFSLKGITTYGKIISNYDGDTADCILIYKDNFMRYKVRFYGYDSPEMKPSLSIKDRDEIKKKAIEAKKRLWKLCSDLDDINEKYHKKIIKIVCDDFDKYGRLLITAFNSDFKDNLDFDNSINKIMIDEGHGYSYFGGTKK